MKPNLKLYFVSTKGAGSAYVVALNSDEAYERFKLYLDGNVIGMQRERVLKTIELLAENCSGIPIGGVLLFSKPEIIKEMVK